MIPCISDEEKLANVVFAARNFISYWEREPLPQEEVNRVCKRLSLLLDSEFDEEAVIKGATAVIERVTRFFSRKTYPGCVTWIDVLIYSLADMGKIRVKIEPEKLEELILDNRTALRRARAIYN